MFQKIRKFFTERKARRNARNAKTIKNAKAIREDRAAAIEYFKFYDDPAVAVPALLQRFEYSLEHGINDTREKEAAMAGIVRHGEAALPFVRDHLFQTTRIAWPIKVLNALGKDAEVVETLKGALNFGDVAFDQAIVDKNYDILCYLRDYKLAGFATKVSHFLTDPDERVRFACVELLLEQEDPEVAGLVEPLLADESADNRRIRQAVLEAFLARGWTVKNREPFNNGHITGNIFVSPKGALERRRI